MEANLKNKWNEVFHIIIKSVIKEVILKIFIRLAYKNIQRKKNQPIILKNKIKNILLKGVIKVEKNSKVYL